MSKGYGGWILSVVLILSGTACKNMKNTSEAHLARMDEAKAAYGEPFELMVDNAVIRDMSVSDVHFVAHTNELSGIGEVRLNRLARVLTVYGGTVRYATAVTNEEVIKKRLGHVREYLELAGCDMDRVQFAWMMSGGHGMPGDEAVAKYNKITGMAQPGSGASAGQGASLSAGEMSEARDDQ